MNASASFRTRRNSVRYPPRRVRISRMDLPTRETLIRRVRDLGDSGSWAEFWGLYEPVIGAYLRRLRVREHDAADLTQDVYLKLRRELPRFTLESQRGNFRGWLRRVTDNMVRDHFRAARRDEDRIEDAAEYKRAVEVSFDDSSERDAVRAREWRQNVMTVILEKARAEFTDRPKLWKCFDMTLLRRLPAKEVAAELGIDKVNNVYVYAHRVLQRVRALSEEFDPDESVAPLERGTP